MTADFFNFYNVWIRKKVLKRKAYPREVLQTNSRVRREVVRDDFDIMEYVVQNNYVDCYASVFSNWQIMNREFDTIYIDVDMHNGNDFEVMIKEAYKKLQKVLMLLHEYEPRVYATGRGFAVWLDFPIMHLELYGDVVRQWMWQRIEEYVKKENSDYGKRKIEKKVKEVMNELIDTNVFGDIRRVARLPITVNSKVGVRCVPINAEWSIDKIIACMRGKVEPYCYEIRHNNVLANELKEIEKQIKEKRGERYEVFDVNNLPDGITEYVKSLSLEKLPLCIKNGVENLIRYGELEHVWRVVITIFLVKAWSEERVAKLYEMFASDYDPKKTQYQINFIVRKGYYCYSCKKLKMLGICPYSNQRKCPYYILTDGWLERMFMRSGDGNGKACK